MVQTRAELRSFFGAAVGALAGLVAVGVVLGAATHADPSALVALHRRFPAFLVLDTLPFLLALVGLLIDRNQAADAELAALRAAVNAWSDGAVGTALLDPALVVGPDGVVVAGNAAAAAVFGSDPAGAAIGALFEEGAPGPHAAGGRDRVVEGRVVGVEWPRTLRTPAGPRPVLVSIAPASGRRTVWVARPEVAAGSSPAAVEATERALAEARDALRSRGAWFAGIVHELRTPLTAILGYTELLREDLAEGGGDHLTEVDAVHTAARHLVALVNDVLELSRLESGRGSVVLDLVQVGPLVAEVEATARALAAKNRNTLTTTVAPEVALVRADALRLRQVLINLLGNACKFTTDGTVSLRVRFGADAAGRGAVLFEVADTGIGMTPEQLSRLFQDWAQADPDIRRRYGGSGLGLALSRRLAEAMGGALTASSTPGQGSVFRLALPWTEWSQRTIVPEGLGSGSLTPAEVRAPLVFVDRRTPVARERLAEALRLHGLGPVTWADDPSPGALAALRPRAVVVDGDDALTDRLAAAEALVHVPLLTTAPPTDEPTERIGWLSRPLDPREATVVLRRLERSVAGALVPDAGPLADRVATALAERGWAVARAADPARRFALVVVVGDTLGPAGDAAVVRLTADAIAEVPDDAALADLVEATATPSA